VFPGKSLWYLTRGTGAVALILLTISLVLGIAATMGAGGRRTPRFVVQGLHRNISLLVMVFLGLHIVTTVADHYVPIGWVDAIVPFSSPYKPLWVGLGALATDLLIALILSSLLRVHIGPNVWRTIHWSAYLCWPITVIHGLGIGSDTHARWMLIVNGACVMAVSAAVFMRIVRRDTVRLAMRSTMRST
jgi:methionine sulfoxide reductase heme-binding subunit